MDAVNCRPMHSYVSVGIVHFMAFPECMSGEGPIVESLSRIVEDEFFSGIEVTRIANREHRRTASSMLRDSCLSVGFGCQPMLLAGGHDLNSLDGTKRKQAVDVVLEGLEQAVELGADKLAVLSGPDPGAAQRPAAIDALVESLTTLAEHCREAGLQLSLETFDRDVDKKRLIGPNSLGAMVSDRVRSHAPSFGLLVDLSHVPLQGEGIGEAVRATRQHLSHVHIGNCVLQVSHPLYGDQHPRIGHPSGSVGVAQLSEFLGALLSVGYLEADKRASIAFEVKPTPGESSIALIAQSKRALNRAWATLSDEFFAGG